MAGEAAPQRKAKWRPLLLLVMELVVAGAFILAQSQGCRRRASLSPVSESRFAMGTIVKVSLAPTEVGPDRENLRLAMARIHELEDILGSQQPEFELSRVNAAAGEDAVAVSPDLFRAIRAGVEWHGRTQRCFDITAGPLIGLWRSCGSADRLPTEAELQRARSLLGADRIELDAETQTVRLPTKGMSLHLGGIGKGFCADEVVALLRERGVTSALVAMSGDIYALGRRPDGKAWYIGIQDPRLEEALITTVYLIDAAVSTSGNYRRYQTIQRKTYSHIVDPRSGRTADNVPSVTVIGPDALTTDILGTALSVLGVEEGAALVEAMPGVEALFITYDENNTPQLRRTNGFAHYEAPPDAVPN